jgi:hypothetical protein
MNLEIILKKIKLKRGLKIDGRRSIYELGSYELESYELEVVSYKF